MTSEFVWTRLSPTGLQIENDSKIFIYTAEESDGIENIMSLIEFLGIKRSESETKRTGKK